MSGPGVNAVFAALAAARQGQITTAALAKELANLDAFRGLGRDNPVAKYSASVLDALPKLFLQHAGAAETVGEQLAEKLAHHELLLQLLGDAGALARLHPSVLRCLFEDGQRLQALLDLRELESKLSEQHARSGDPGPLPLTSVVEAAGVACMPAVAGSGERTPAEVFYACPTQSLDHFFDQAATFADTAGRQAGAAAAESEAVGQLSRALQVLLGGALQQRARQQQFFGSALNSAVAGLDDAEWTAGEGARRALQALAEACCRLHPLLKREAPQLMQPCTQLLLELADRLLNAYAAAVAAAAPGAPQQRLHQSYLAARESLLGAALDQALQMERQEEAEAAIRRTRGLAEAHAAYPPLFDVADATGDREGLYGAMQQLRGDALNPPFSTYVFARLLREGRQAELLDLPAAFDQELQAFLSDQSAPDAPQRARLRWLHELRTGNYKGAAATLAGCTAGSTGAGAAEGAADLAVDAELRMAAMQKLAALAACPLWPLAVDVESEAGELAAAAGERLDQAAAAAALG